MNTMKLSPTGGARSEPEGGQSSKYDVERSTLPASDRLDEAAKSSMPTKANGTGLGTGEAVGAKTLDDWLAEEQESEESSEETEEESSEEEDDEEGEDEEDDEEEEEESDSDDDGEADRLVKS